MPQFVIIFLLLVQLFISFFMATSLHTPPWLHRSDCRNPVFPFCASHFLVACVLARIIHEGSSRKHADAKRDGHSET